MRGELKPGYKQTEVGVIPEEWEVRRLKELFTIKSGFAFSSTFFSDKGPILLTPGNFKLEGGLYFNDRNTKRYSGPYSSSMLFDYGDLLIVMTDLTPDCNLLGKPAFVRFYEPILHNQRIGKIVPNSSRVSLAFLHWFFLSAKHAARMKETATGSTVRHTSNSSIYNSLIALPPTKAEQEAIAEVLSDADALIESLEQLIAKKHQIKHGAMQELLTGKKRLPGFETKPGYKQTEVGVIPEDWDSPELGDLLKSMQLGGNYKNSDRETNWPLIKMGNLGRGSIKLDKLEFINSVQGPSSRDRLEDDDVLLNTRNTLDLVGKVAIWRNELPEAYFNSNIMRMKFDEQRVSSYHFMNYILNTSRSLRGLRGIAIGTTSVAAIYSRDLVKLKIPLPTKAEQTAIAAILSDMDAEIAALENRLAKARQLKQGMMQELLTGNTRLVESEK